MKVVRLFWGDLGVFNSKFKTQIDRASQSPIENQIVYVWGKENENFFIDRGFDTKLVSDTPYTEGFGEGHHMFNYTSLLHKLMGVDIAVKEFGEILFLDWDCYLLKPFDDKFISLIRERGPLQVPLYIYPYEGIQDLLNRDLYEEFVVNFATVLKDNLEVYSYKEELGYVLPNTGFMYCRDSNISSDLLKYGIEYNLKAVPDEFAVMAYAMKHNLNLKDYIQTIEPLVINGKLQEDEDAPYWVKSQKFLNNLTSSFLEKEIYFNHV